MAKGLPQDGVGDWQPNTPDNRPMGYTKLLDPNAKDAPDTFNGTNVLKNFVGGRGKPSGDLGSQGRDF